MIHFPQCKYIYSRGKNERKRCNVAPHKGRDYCSAHHRQLQNRLRNQQIADTALSNDTVFANLQGGANTKVPKDFGRPKGSNLRIQSTDNRFSVWMITINTGKSYEMMSFDEKTKFKMFCQYLFGEQEGIINFMTDGGNVEDPRENLLNCDTQYYFEIGPKYQKLHCHAVVRCEHTSYYQINLANIRELSRRIFGYALYLNVIASNDPVQAMINYASKKQSRNIIDL